MSLVSGEDLVWLSTSVFHLQLGGDAATSGCFGVLVTGDGIK